MEQTTHESLIPDQMDAGLMNLIMTLLHRLGRQDHKQLSTRNKNRWDHNWLKPPERGIFWPFRVDHKKIIFATKSLRGGGASGIKNNTKKCSKRVFPELIETRIHTIDLKHFPVISSLKEMLVSSIIRTSQTEINLRVSLNNRCYPY